MAIEPNWDEWNPLDLILDERVSSFVRYAKNFAMQGLELAPGVGLQILIGAPGLNVGYINGYEYKQTNAVTRSLQPNTTNYIYVAFTKTPDPIGGTAAINPFTVVNQSGIAPSNSLKIGEVDTNGVGITAIRQVNNHFHIADSQLDTDIEGNHHQIIEQVLHKGPTFPTNAQAGQPFYNTTLGAAYVYNGVSWDILIGAFDLIAGQAIAAGEFVRISPGVNNTGIKTNATTTLGTHVVGVAKNAVALGNPFLAFSPSGQKLRVQFETGLVLTADDEVFLSALTAGALTNIAPPNAKSVGRIADASAYLGVLPSNSKADIVFQMSGGGGTVDPRDIMRYSMMSEEGPIL